jgi:hypothetical protein
MTHTRISPGGRWLKPADAAQAASSSTSLPSAIGMSPASKVTSRHAVSPHKGEQLHVGHLAVAGDGWEVVMANEMLLPARQAR